MPCLFVLRVYGGLFDLPVKKRRLLEIERELEQPALWNDPEAAQIFSKERAALVLIIDSLTNIETDIQETGVLYELILDEKDDLLLPDVLSEINRIDKVLAEKEFQRLFSGEMDAHSAYLDVQSGSGGTEAQDWAEMLFRLYSRWGDQHGFTVRLIEKSPGDVAGIKSATLLFEGAYAYGWLRTETGVHRLVRKSPFDSGSRRHTSFASIFVSPEIDEDLSITINPADLRIDTYRSSGAGGQHVNRTDSAVRITHLPTDTVVQCQNDRSQHKNKAQAMKQLKAKLYELEMLKKNEEQQALEATKSDIGWGSQIRSYVLDASRVKDLRTGVETSDTQSVLDGGIDLFIQACLRQENKKEA